MVILLDMYSFAIKELFFLYWNCAIRAESVVFLICVCAIIIYS